MIGTSVPMSTGGYTTVDPSPMGAPMHPFASTLPTMHQTSTTMAYPGISTTAPRQITSTYATTGMPMTGGGASVSKFGPTTYTTTTGMMRPATGMPVTSISGAVPLPAFTQTSTITREMPVSTTTVSTSGGPFGYHRWTPGQIYIPLNASYVASTSVHRISGIMPYDISLVPTFETPLVFHGGAGTGGIYSMHHTVHHKTREVPVGGRHEYVLSGRPVVRSRSIPMSQHGSVVVVSGGMPVPVESAVVVEGGKKKKGCCAAKGKKAKAQPTPVVEPVVVQGPGATTTKPAKKRC